MDPRRTDLDAFFAFAATGGVLHLINRRDMRATIGHSEASVSWREMTGRWPELPAAWADTYATLHMWTQIVGKIALAQAPPLNHCWSAALQLTARGLTTRPLPHGDRTFAIEFDFAGHQLVLTTSNNIHRSLPLAPCTVADFYKQVMTTLAEMKLPLRIWTMPV